MVKTSTTAVKMILAVLIAFPLMLAAPAAEAQEIEEYDFTVDEEYRIEINDLGDAEITDRVSYDEAWFEEYGSVFDEYPNLLSRRFRTDTNVGEVEDFDVEIDPSNAVITVTFTTPGMVYNFGDEWALLWGPGYELTSLDDQEAVLSASWYATGEFTLFEEVPWQQTVVVDLPEGATGARYDENEGAIYYRLDYVEEGAGVLAENRTIFLLVFGLLMGLTLLLLILVLTRKEREPVSPVTLGAAAPGPVPPVKAQPPGYPPAAAPAEPPAPVAPAAQAPPETAARPRFCKKCGSPVEKEGSFCKKCGSPLV